MKILVDFQDTIGGAPRSLKEHALLLKENGHEIVAVIAEKNFGNFFDDTGFEIVQIPRFYTKYVLRNFVLIFKYYKLIKQKKIDFIYTNRVLQCQFLSIVSDFCNVPILNARAGGYITSDIVKVQKDKHYIVYSEENLEAFQKAGFSSTHLFLLRNRIPVPELNDLSNMLPEKEVNITVTGSVKADTLNGLIWFMNFIKKNAFNSEIKYQINLAGSNILKAENEKIKFEQELSQTQQTLPPNWSIKHLGWVENINELQAKSHICIGKGRSVIQPGMMGKIAFVISESGTLYRCKKDSYKDLLFVNFSGRGKIIEEKDSVNEFKELLTNRNKFFEYQEEANELMQKFKEDYATEYAKEKLEKIVNTVKSKQIIKFGFYKGFTKLIKIYVFTIMEIINKRE